MPTPHTHPKVFISYSHDSLEHSDRVRELSDRLRADGIDCILDQYEVSPPEGWPRWMDTQIREADFVLMICTETYYLRVMGKERPGAGLGVRWEGNLIYQYIYNLGTINTTFIPVLLEGGNSDHIPTPLQGVNYYSVETEAGYLELYRRLTAQPEYTKPELGKMRVLGEVKKLQPLEPKERKQDFFAAQLANLPFERNPFFTGREKLLNDLHTAFTTGGATQAISGFGGLGKTQTAIEYAYRHRGDYKAVFWVRADSQLALSTGFVEIARVLDLPEKDAQNPDDAVRAVKAWLQNNPGWLLICDNADLPELVKEFRPRNAQGHILLTSRAQNFDVLGFVKAFQIEEMSSEEALKFLFTRTGRDGDNVAEKEAAAQLAGELGYLPLALEQAGAFITAKRARFQDYLASYRKRHLKLLKESRPVTGDYTESVATTWSINFGEVEKVSAAASDLLRLSAFLSPESIPFELITSGKLQLGDALSAALADVEADPLALNNVLEPLTSYSLIRVDGDSQTYSIHRLVQEVVVDELDESLQSLWVERTVRALNDAFPSVEFENWKLCERLLPHARAAEGLIEKWNLAVEESARLLNQAALFCFEQGQYVEAAPMFSRSLLIREILNPSDQELALGLNNLAALYQAQGKYAEAEPLLKRSLEICEQALGPYHADVAFGLNNLAELYRVQEEYAKAEPLYHRSLAIREKTLGADDPRVATALNNLALLCKAQGRFEEAEQLYERALAIDEKALGPDHPKVGPDLNNLGELYRSQGKLNEAEGLFQRSLKIFEKALGPNHPHVASCLNNLAVLYHSQGKHAEAKPLYERALVILERALGQNHPNVIRGLMNYAGLLRSMRLGNEAEEVEARAKALRSK